MAHEKTIDRSSPVIVNCNENVRQVVYIQDDCSGYAAVEMYDKQSRAWNEIHGHDINEEQVVNFIKPEVSNCVIGNTGAAFLSV